MDGTIYGNAMSHNIHRGEQRVDSSLRNSHLKRDDTSGMKPAIHMTFELQKN